MNRTLHSVPLLVLAAGVAVAQNQDGVVDLTAPYNYAGQPVPAYVTLDNTPPDNAITDLGATLGRVLFYDRRLSRTDTVSCASCHQQQHAFGDATLASAGVAGTTGRHSMRLVNARFSAERRFFWDERAASAEDQATRPIQDHVEMGFSGANGDPDFGELIGKLSALEEYQVLFTGVFGDPAVTEARVQRALAQFVRSIQSFDSKYDEGRRRAPGDNAPFPNFTASENAGKQLFLTPPQQGGAGCAACHRAPEFSIDPNSGNNGTGGAIGGGTDFTVTKAPSLRDVVAADGAPHGPFMHDGSRADLGAVVAHYNAIPAPIPGLDRRLTVPGGPPGPAGDLPQRLNLTVQERADLLTFLGTLTGRNVYLDEKWSDPFDDSGRLTLIVLPPKMLETTRAGDEITLRCVGVRHLNYVAQWSSDLSFDQSAAVTADANGELAISLPVSETEPRMFYRFAYVPAGLQGE